MYIAFSTARKSQQRCCLAAGPVRQLLHVPSGLHETSYTWKHRVERWGRVLGFSNYISNGAFITAADWLGVPSRRIPKSPNVFYALKSLRDDIGQGVEFVFDPTWERSRRVTPSYSTVEAHGAHIVNPLN